MLTSFLIYLAIVALGGFACWLIFRGLFSSSSSEKTAPPAAIIEVIRPSCQKEWPF